MVRSLAFLGDAGKRILCESWHREGSEPIGCVVLLPPFGEEMNRCRRVLANLGAALGTLGLHTVLPDLSGTGDSDGDFGDASVSVWYDDLDIVVHSLPDPTRLHLVAFRFGALLVADVSKRYRCETATLVQPLLTGDQLLRQLIRIRLAASMFSGGRKETSDSLMTQLAGGERLEFGGYEVSFDLYSQLKDLSLAEMQMSRIKQLYLIEIGSQQANTAFSNLVQTWSSDGGAADTSLVNCDAFWATQETSDCTKLIEVVAAKFKE